MTATPTAKNLKSTSSAELRHDSSVMAAGGAKNGATHGAGLVDNDVLRVIRDDGTLDPSRDPKLGDEWSLHIYQWMVRTRVIDERLVTLQRQGRIGFHIGSLGEEASILGSASAARDQDWIFPCYREFGALLLRGMPLQRYIDNMFGNENDPARGRQMPDHYSGRPYKFGSVSSPIGTQITQAVGFSWAAKMRKDPLAALVYFGEGATSSNEFHNAANFAGVFKTPTIFLCRNNGWAISVPAEKQSASATFADKALAYGIRGVRCDGNDIFAVYSATRDAIDRAARGEGATLIEMLTYRLSGHSTSDDPKAYRKETEVEAWRSKDPVTRLRGVLEKKGQWSSEKQSRLEDAIASEVQECIKVAETTAPPALSSMFDDVYGELPQHLIEQRAELLQGPRAKGHGH
ncbi:MAG: pyruvate dehydrogenase (acetyl-transferring) E1 component subunit alpha [Polyangiales bacterium]